MTKRELTASVNKSLGRARRVQPKTVTRRIDIMVRNQVIRGASILVGQKYKKYHIRRYLLVSLNNKAAERLERFEKRVSTVQRVNRMEKVTGEFDYIVRVEVRDDTHYEEVHRNIAREFEAGDDSTTLSVMSTITEEELAGTWGARGQG